MTDSPTKQSFLKRGVKHLALFFGMLLCLLLAVKMGLGLLGAEDEQIQALDRLKNSPMLVWIRYGIYVAIIVFWKPILRKINSRLREEIIKATYRPLIVCLVLYECMLARNVIGALLN